MHRDPSGFAMQTVINLGTLLSPTSSAGTSFTLTPLKTANTAENIVTTAVPVIDGTNVPKVVVSSGAPDVHLSQLNPGSIRDINPGYKIVPDRINNCVNCAIATDTMLSGKPAQALPGTQTSASVVEDFFEAKFVSASQDKIISEFQNAGSGARGIVLGVFDDGQSHVFNVVNQQGNIRFLDGQTGKPASFNGFVKTFVLPTNLPN
jgi:filamentous hemagglutinin